MSDNEDEQELGSEPPKRWWRADAVDRATLAWGASGLILFVASVSAIWEYISQGKAWSLAALAIAGIAAAVGALVRISWKPGLVRVVALCVIIASSVVLGGTAEGAVRAAFGYMTHDRCSVQPQQFTLDLVNEATSADWSTSSGESIPFGHPGDSLAARGYVDHGDSELEDGSRPGRQLYTPPPWDRNQSLVGTFRLPKPIAEDVCFQAVVGSLAEAPAGLVEFTVQCAKLGQSDFRTAFSVIDESANGQRPVLRGNLDDCEGGRVLRLVTTALSDSGKGGWSTWTDTGLY
jgi:hypothetical protein